MKILRYIISLALLLLSFAGSAQLVECTVKGNGVYFSIELNHSKPILDSLCKSLETGKGFSDSLYTGKVQRGTTTKKYVVYSLDKKYLTLKAPLIQYAQTPMGVFDILMIEELFGEKQGNSNYSDKQYGSNQFVNSETTVQNGTVKLVLQGHTDAGTVYAGGSFNNWNFLKTPMRKTNNGWEVELGLKPGKHLYKFVVDGQWELDKTNKLKEGDGLGNTNNVLFVPNHTFSLKGFKEAKKVYVSTSFNSWNERELALFKTAGGWELNLFVPEGTHAYKFIVDNRWIIDPSNPITRPDEQGILNSYLAIGDTFYFNLKAYPNASEVFVSGNFNAWQTQELAMRKTKNGWRLGYVLGAGNYQYKFIVDGRWILDPENPYTAQEAYETNSLLAVKPNHTFVYPHHKNVKDVRLSGSFNEWNEFGYTMRLGNNTWSIPLYLHEGKHTYKFIVDGNWMLDENNPLYEQNEFGTGNSVLWINEK